MSYFMNKLFFVTDKKLVFQRRNLTSRVFWRTAFLQVWINVSSLSSAKGKSLLQIHQALTWNEGVMRCLLKGTQNICLLKMSLTLLIALHPSFRPNRPWSLGWMQKPTLNVNWTGMMPCLDGTFGDSKNYVPSKFAPPHSVWEKGFAWLYLPLLARKWVQTCSKGLLKRGVRVCASPFGMLIRYVNRFWLNGMLSWWV